MFLEKRVLFIPCHSPPAAHALWSAQGLQTLGYWLFFREAGPLLLRCFLQQPRARRPEGMCLSCMEHTKGQARGSSIQCPVHLTWSLEQMQRSVCDGG